MSDEESQQSSSEESEEESEEETEKEKREKSSSETDSEEEERRRREEEVAQERQRKLEEKKRKEAEEASKKQRKPGQKRKGLGGLSKEKKRLLKQLIMQKAADEMKAEMKRRQEERENFLRGKVEPLKLDGLGENDLNAKVKQLYERVRQLEGDKYDWEEKLRRQDFEINELTIKVNDVKGKFVKPVLKKVSKTESHMARFEKKEGGHSLSSFRSQLKSTGHSKYALEEKDEVANTPK